MQGMATSYEMIHQPDIPGSDVVTMWGFCNFYNYTVLEYSRVPLPSQMHHFSGFWLHNTESQRLGHIQLDLSTFPFHLHGRQHCNQSGNTPSGAWWDTGPSQAATNQVAWQEHPYQCQRFFLDMLLTLEIWAKTILNNVKHMSIASKYCILMQNSSLYNV